MAFIPISVSSIALRRISAQFCDALRDFERATFTRAAVSAARKPRDLATSCFLDEEVDQPGEPLIDFVLAQDVLATSHGVLLVDNAGLT
jgi:hypothetical protein